MNYKCRFCGYRFRDKDEQICPECLTAREDDISCSVYGEDEHSHELYDSLYGAPRLSAKNDTFRDGSENFLREELRSENRSRASKYERKNGGDINVAADPRRQNVSVQYSNSTRNYVPPSASGYAPPPKNKNNGGCGKGCVIFFIVILIFVPVLFGVFVEYGKAHGIITEENADSETEQQAAAVDQGDIDCFLASTERSEYDSVSNDISDFKLQNLMLLEDDELTPARNASPRQIYGYNCVIRFIYMEDGSKVDLDELDITSISCIAIDENGIVLSTYDSLGFENTIYAIGDTSETRPYLYCDAAADELIISVETDCKGEPMTFQLNIDVQ